MVLLSLREKNLAKIQVENDKKIFVLPCQVGEREKKLKNFLKRMFETVKELFLKNLKYDVRSIEKQVRSIEPGRGSQNFKTRFRLIENQIGSIEILEKTAFERKKLEFLKSYLKALNITKQMHEYEMKCSPKTQVLNPIFQKFRF